MSSILKVNEIQNVSTGNTAMTINDSGGATFPATLTSTGAITASSGVVHGGYELIQSKVSTSHNQHAGGSALEFVDVFSTNYIQYKVIIGWFLNAGNSGNNVSFRFMSGSSQINSGNSYRYVIHRFGDTDTGAYYRANSSNEGAFFHTIGGETNGANGGMHGELTIMNPGFYNLGGTSTQRKYSNNTTNVYAPIMFGTIIGISVAGSEYERQDSMVRLNSSQEPSYYTGFAILTSASGEAAGTSIAVYGMRSA